MQIVQSLTNKLMNKLEMQGRNITMDRLYTSFELVEWMLDKNITVVGTLMSNRRGIPSEIKSIVNRENNSYKCFWEKEKLHCNPMWCKLKV